MESAYYQQGYDDFWQGVNDSWMYDNTTSGFDADRYVEYMRGYRQAEYDLSIGNY